MNKTNKTNHSTTKDEEVAKEIKKLKIFLLTNGVKVLIFILALVIVASLISYYFWDENKYISKFQLSVFVGVGTFIYTLYYFLKPTFLVFKEPKGIELTHDVPLYEVVNILAEKINTPKIEKIFLVDDLNAYVSSYRRWLSPTKKHYLSIGLQLLATINVKELKSVIAHELGHISKDHADFSNFIYRIYIGLHSFELEHYMRGGSEESLNYGFYGKFVKKLDEMSYATKRNNEFQADEIAAKFTSPKIAASALCRIYYVADWVQISYWDNVWKESWKYPVPQDNVIVNACNKIMNYSVSELTGNFDKVKITKTKKGDTHPSLKDRVNHLKVKIELPKKINQDDLAIFTLGKKKNKYLEQCDDFWQKNYLYEWQAHHEYMSNCIMRRDLLIKSKSNRDLLIGEYFEIAHLEEVVNNDKTALKGFYDTYKSEPRSLFSLFNMARLMLKTNHPKAEATIVKVMNKNPNFQYQGADLLLKYFYDTDDIKKINHYKEIKQKAKNILEVRAKKPFKRVIPHGLAASEINEIVVWLKQFGGIYWAILFKLKPEKDGMPGCPNYEMIISVDFCIEQETLNSLYGGLFLNGTIIIRDEEDLESSTYLVDKKLKEAIIFGKDNFQQE